MEKFTIDTALAALLMARETKKAAEKQEKAAAEFIKAYAARLPASATDAAGRTAFKTDEYSVIMDKRQRIGLDTATLYKDFPDIKDTYGTVTEYVTIVAAARSAAEKTA